VEGIAVEGEDLDRPRLGIDEPVLTHPGAGIECPLGEQIVAAIGGTDDLDRQIGRTLYPAPDGACVSTLQHDHNIWLDRIGAWENTSTGAVTSQPPSASITGPSKNMRFLIVTACIVSGDGISYNFPSMIS
jgi:hypothetical protein